MIKRLAMALSLLAYLIFSVTQTVTLSAQEDENPLTPTVVYIDNTLCEDCQRVKNHGVLEGLESKGIEIIIYNVDNRNHLRLVNAYYDTYGVKGTTAAPMIYVGDTYFQGYRDIIDAYDDGIIESLADTPLLPIDDYIPRQFGFWSGLVFIILAGLLDGVNPCAIAMLLMFISMVGFTKNKRVLLTVSVSYIGAIFITYLAIGFGFLTLLGISREAFTNVSYYLYGGFAVLCIFLFVITLYDFIVTRNEQYGKVKNQLPKFIQALNKRVMHRFTTVINQEDGGLKQVLVVVFVPVLLGIIVGITEAACTGQIYFAVLGAIAANNPTGSIAPVELFYIIVFNFMFVLPLITIALIAIKSQSVVGVANFIREHLSAIKFATSLFFLLMAVYFILMIFDIGFL